MLKSIKKSFKYLTIAAGIILLVPAFLYSLVRIPEVQTFIVRRITSHLSNEIKSTISVGRIEYAFFNKLTINDLIIKDRNNDTLIYSRKISAGIRRLDLRNNNIRLGKVEITQPHVALITDTTGSMNLKWYLDLIRKPSDTPKKKKSLFAVNNITIKDARFSLINRTGTDSKMLIDFNNLRITGINGDINDLAIRNDSTLFSIAGLEFKESNGFIVSKMETKFAISGQTIAFTGFSLNSARSIINADLIKIAPDSVSSFSRFTEEVKLNILLRKSLVNSSDLHYFLPFLKNTDESGWLSGRISGTISELKGRNIELEYSDNTYIDCDFDFSGLPRIEDAFIFISVNSLKTNAKDLERIQIPGKGNILLPDILYKLDNISFDGSFTGFITDFVTYGKISTGKGDLRTDISLRPGGNNTFRIKGFVTGRNIDLGELTGNREMFGKVSMETNVDVNASSFGKFSGGLNGKIDSIEINEYKYRNIVLNGSFSENKWDGSIKIVDKNIKADFLGLFDFSEDLPEFNFTLNLNDANLNRLNFDKADSSSKLSLLLTANFKGNNIDNLNGEIRLLNSTLRKYNSSLDLYDFSLKTFTENSKPAISIRTDFVNADLRGYYSFKDIGTLFKTTLASLMPSKFPMPANAEGKPGNSFSFNINFKKTDELNNLFKTGILLADKSTVKGVVFADSIIRIDGRAGTFEIKNIVFRDLSFEGAILGQKMTANINSSLLILPGNSELKNFRADFDTWPDNFVFSVKWDNKEKILNKGDFTARGSLTRNADNLSRPFMKIEIDSSGIVTRNNFWKVSSSDISVDSSSVSVNRLIISNDDNYYLVDGTVSENPLDTLHLAFKGIDLSPLNFSGKPDKMNDLPLSIKGILNGNVQVTDIYRNPMVESKILINSFSILGGEYGDISAESVWNSAVKVADIRAGSSLNGKQLLDVRGFYDPATKRINLDANAAKLPVDALNPLLNIFASGIRGTASGKVNLSGEFDKLVLSGALMAENVSMKIDYLMTRYLVNDSIRFSSSGIRLNNVRLNDEKGNFATISGAINHRYFNNFSADLLINMNECLVLNTQAKDNELFYGTVYATGVTTIKSRPDLLSFDISARTRRNTKFFIPLNSGLSVSEHSFVTFINPDSLKAGTDERKPEASSIPPPRSGIELNLDLDVTPDAEVQLLIDPKAGDVIRGRGAGRLNINLNRKGDFRISGDYIIEEGDYLFTLGNILNKPFTVENGGKITFPGDVENAEIDIRAIYRIRTSLYEILRDDRFNDRIPVECQLNLSGKLFNPIVGFDIYLPNADEETRTYLRNAITTEEELSRQFLYLLVMNSFYSDPSYRSSLSTASTGTSAMAVTTTEMLSNQLSNWLSQISNDFDIGFVYRPGYKDVNSQEVQVALSTQILNDRVTINGNFDVRGADNSYGNPITGDFEIEYKLAEKIRFKVFNRFNNPYTGKGVPYTQGIGLFFKQDFNSLSDLLFRKRRSEIKKEDEVIIE